MNTNQLFLVAAVAKKRREKYFMGDVRISSANELDALECVCGKGILWGSVRSRDSSGRCAGKCGYEYLWDGNFVSAHREMKGYGRDFFIGSLVVLDKEKVGIEDPLFEMIGEAEYPASKVEDAEAYMVVGMKGEMLLLSSVCDDGSPCVHDESGHREVFDGLGMSFWAHRDKCIETSEFPQFKTQEDE